MVQENDRVYAAEVAPQGVEGGTPLRMSERVTGRLWTHGDGLPVEHGFHDGHGQHADGLEAVFPIIRRSDKEIWEPIGTGFFISNNGLFATAKHVVVNDRTGKVFDSLAGVQMVRREQRVIIRDVIKVCAHATADVAIGFLFDQKFFESGQQSVNKCFALTLRDPAVGEKVATFAFPKSTAAGNEHEFEIMFTSSSVVGTVENVLPNGRDRTMLPSKCFQTSMNILGGASGGPVAFGEGNVFGINSTGVDGEDGVSFISSIGDLFDLSIPTVRLPDGTIKDKVNLSDLQALGLIAVR